MTGNALEVAGLHAGYARRAVIRGLSLPPLPAGTITAVIGPNGAGKTTLLRALGGLLPAQGEVRFGGRNLLTCGATGLARLVTYMPQAIPQGVALTVIEAVMTALRVASPLDDRSDAAVHARADAVLDGLGIGPLALHPIDELSGGQRQLVSLAQAIVRRPAILLLDEPTSALDPRHQIDVMSAVRKASVDDGMIVLAVMHDLNLALRWADNIVLLDDGVVVAAGPPERTITAGILSAAYKVTARIEHCSQGRMQVLFDDRVA